MASICFNAIRRIAASLLLFATSTPAQAPVLMTSEPHHHLVLENSCVRVFKVEVPPHEATLLHLHPRDYAYVVLGDADVANAVAGKAEVTVHLKEGDANFTRGGFAHVARNLSDRPFRNISIELLHPQGGIKQSSPTAVSPNPQLEGVGRGRTLFETDATKAIRTWIAPGGKGANDPALEVLVVVLNGANLRAIRAGGSAILHPGDTLWIPRGTQFNLRNEGTEAARVVFLEFSQ